MTLTELQTAMMDAVRDIGTIQNPRLTDTPKGIYMDSLDEVDLVVHLEDRLGIEIPEEWLHEEYREKSFGDLAVILEAKLKDA